MRAEQLSGGCIQRARGKQPSGGCIQRAHGKQPTGRCIDRVRAEQPSLRVFVAKKSREEAGFSSTEVREALDVDDFEYARLFLPVNTATFMMEPSREELRAFKDDYAKYGKAA